MLQAAACQFEHRGVLGEGARVALAGERPAANHVEAPCERDGRVRRARLGQGGQRLPAAARRVVTRDVREREDALGLALGVFRAHAAHAHQALFCTDQLRALHARPVGERDRTLLREVEPHELATLPFARIRVGHAEVAAKSVERALMRRRAKTGDRPRQGKDVGLEHARRGWRDQRRYDRGALVGATGQKDCER